MSDEQTLRDTFAAAALTGIIAASDDSEIKRPQAEFLARQAWLVADAMLRERAATNHDAAPAATAEVATGTGHTTRKPDALLVLDREGFMRDFFTDDDAARKFAIQLGGTCVPLYRDPPPPVLTDAERAFLQRERDLLDADDAGDSKDLGIINGLLARLGGEQ